MARDLKKYLEFISDKGSSIPLKTQWVVDLSGVPPYVLENLDLEKYEPQKWTNGDTELRNNIISKYVSSTQNGFMYVGLMTTPDTQAKVTAMQYNNGGYNGIPTVQRTLSENTIETEILETEYSIVDFLLRPWSIIVAYEGLIASNDKTSVKAKHLTLLQYRRDGLGTRKKITFYNICPIQCKNIDVGYKDDGVVNVKVGWIYTHYVIETEKFSNINSTNIGSLGSNESSGGIFSTIVNGVKSIF